MSFKCYAPVHFVLQRFPGSLHNISYRFYLLDFFFYTYYNIYERKYAVFIFYFNARREIRTYLQALICAIVYKKNI